MKFPLLLSKKLVGALGIALLLVGCGGKFDSRASGRVTLDGKSLESGVVTFHPDANGPTAYGVINGEGEYKAATGQGSGLPSGDYLVTVVANEPQLTGRTGSGPPPPGRRLTAEYLSDKKTTNLRRTMDPGSNRYDIDLSTP